MSLNPQLSIAARNAANDAITAKINVGGAGTLLLYTTAQPTSPDTAIGAQVLLATLTYSATSFGASAVGVATANAVTSGIAVANGTATWGRSKSGGGTAVVDLSVGPVSLITTVSLATNVATFTTLAAHGFTAGTTVVIVAGLANAFFNGTYTVATTPTATTFTVPLTHADFGSAADIGTANGQLYDVNLGTAVISSGTVVSVTSLTLTHP